MALYNEFIVAPFEAAFPEEELFCEPSALFSDGDAPAAAAKVLVIGHFATRRFFQQTGERQPAQKELSTKIWVRLSMESSQKEFVESSPSL